MREIKFRAYIKKIGWIVPVERINFDCETVEVDLTKGNGDIAEYDFDEMELMQYSGLNDKNGIKIYEGDILRNAEGHIFDIDFHEGMFTKSKELFPFKPCKSEIIGNIYDNPELQNSYMKGERK